MAFKLTTIFDILFYNYLSYGVKVNLMDSLIAI